ncbi:hypothetical protein, conserved [Eimeria tenella]|uniref:SAG family member n=1 Tax=Eimeria tenella TaxID=5802 RepID=U6KSH4_EIMTE|nr:hypothetical protein, conserved [Eimeria tenella]CDJ41067.1 hypothetical protein, conserved [Eimeria tenella]|eukprot:XP_013231817.1 hypothetical protein, conserved [Eimeria tenella]
MAPKHLIAVALAAALAVRAEPEQTPPPCAAGEVRFEGRATFDENERPRRLSRDAVLTIDVSEEVASGEEPKEPIYTHTIPLEQYTPESEIPYSFCADMQKLDAQKISLKARILDASEEDRVECIGETVVTAGSDSYEADLTLAKVDSGTSNGELSVADCNFTQLSEDVSGIAVKAAVEIKAPRSLPKPTYLVVTLRETDPDTGAPEVISLFAGDISAIYVPQKPVPAFLCAKVPTAPEESVKYTIEAAVHVGWDGYTNPQEEERTPRKGDLVTSEPIEVQVNPEQQDYTVTVNLKPYEPQQ